MIPYVGCEHARGMLQGLIDGELGVDDQVGLESHLRWCRTCAAHVEDLRLIGDSLRMAAATPPLAMMGRGDDDRALGGLQSTVLTRVKAEQEQSLTTRVRRLFDDMHVLWAGLGATTAAAVALILAIAVLQASQNLKAESLAAVIDVLSKPGSDQNPMRLSQVMVPPRLFISEIGDDQRSLEPLPDDDAVFALATVVTREGRISASALLSSRYDNDRGPEAMLTGPSSNDASMLRVAVEQTRFAPAVSVDGPVAVNMVWLIARTTVKGSTTFLDDMMSRSTRARARRAS